MYLCSGEEVGLTCWVSIQVPDECSLLPSLPVSLVCSFIVHLHPDKLCSWGPLVCSILPSRALEGGEIRHQDLGIGSKINIRHPSPFPSAAPPGSWNQREGLVRF